MIHALRKHKGLVVGDNEPYSGKDPNGYTVATHAEAAGLPNVLLEIRQDHLQRPGGVECWCGLIADALRSAREFRRRTAA